MVISRIFALACLSALGAALAITPVQAGQGMVRGAQSWSYQLTGNMSSIAASNADVVVVDADHGGAAARFKTKPGGGRRAAIAYLSVGEAEKWRGYWKGCCASSRPSWLTSTTQGWANNYAVKFWEPGWKAIVQQRVREIFAKGYDGVYLDRIDTWERVGSKAQMIQFIKEIAAQARGLKGDAAIIVQNGEELLDNSSYVSAIDAIAKEDLFHGIRHDGSRNSVGAVKASVGLLQRAKSQGKKIFVVEYLGGATAASVAAEIRKQGFVPNFAGRNLGN
jgi:cysteinyl-tRNA synthetase, unknown class